MLLSKLLTSAEIVFSKNLASNIESIKVYSLCFDSREVTQGALFFALPGMHHHGLSFVQEAIDRGAVAIIAQEELPGLSVPLICVADARKAMACVAATFYRNPSQMLSICGVTGTNGKTTTTYLVHHLCHSSGKPCGLIGTVETLLPGRVEEASRTTPESIYLQRLLAEMQLGGFKAAAMEVASHAIVQERVHEVAFDVAVFTNLTQDHLDYHKTMEAYFEAKATLFSMVARQTKKKGRAVINADDRYGRLLIDRYASPLVNGEKKSSLKIVTFGQGSNVDFRASDIRCTASGTTFCLSVRGKSYLVRSPLIGLFNVYNALGALATATCMGVELRRAIKALASAPQVPGRLERVPGKRNYQVFIDYAHTPDALENVLSTCKQLQSERLVVVFGCGGDRDRAKRPLMAAAAEQYADKIIVTTDNPRSEDPQAIIHDIEKGFRYKNYKSILDRKEAIETAIQEALPGDLIVIAGKGHETYQEVAGVKSPFDDMKMAESAIKSRAF